MNGRILDQCTKDAWDIISGRKKIVGNKIVPCRDDKKEEKKKMIMAGLLLMGRSIALNLAVIKHGRQNFLQMNTEVEIKP